MALTVAGLTKSYRGEVVLDDTSAVFPGGTISAILAPNGAGKTTFFKCLLGLEKYQGEVLLDGVPPDAEGNSWFPVFEDAPCHERLSGLANLRLMVPASTREEVTTRSYLSLHELRARAGTYSHGMRKRLAITAALLSGASCVLWDEPANGLDIDSRSRLRADMECVRDQGRIQVVTGHDFSFYEGLVDQVFVLTDRRLVNCPVDRAAARPGKEHLLDVYREHFSVVGT